MATKGALKGDSGLGECRAAIGDGGRGIQAAKQPTDGGFGGRAVNAVTYLWVALGGALGSVGRAWLAAMAARITGPQFPWGTILINIVGSFVIAFFGTMTAATGGRFALSADARAFVMVGICGGFTTFSSFSLQTLELARDGRPGQALANVALSVCLCLASVTAGYLGAVALNQGRVVESAAQARPVAPAPRVQAILDRPAAADGVLSAAKWLLGQDGHGQIDALAVRPRPLAATLPSEEVVTGEHTAEEAVRSGDAGKLLRAVTDWSERTGDVAVGWEVVEGPPGEAVAARARTADFTVIRRPDRNADQLAQEALHAALFEARCCVLMVPSNIAPIARSPEVIAVAWKHDPAATRAVQSAIPLLRRARRVAVLCATEETGATPVPRVLADHGVSAEVLPVPGEGLPLGAVLIEAAHKLSADLLVLGAFTHSELRERVLGGVTEFVLSEADLPVLMRH